MNCRRERDNTYQNTKRKIEKKYEEIMDHKKKINNLINELDQYELKHFMKYIEKEKNKKIFIDNIIENKEKPLLT